MKNILIFSALAAGGYFIWREWNKPKAYPYDRGPSLNTQSIYSDYEIQQIAPLTFKESAWSGILSDSGDIFGTKTAPILTAQDVSDIPNPWLYDPKKH